MKKEDLQKLLNDMSLEEKIMQLVQLPGQAFEDDAAITGIAEAEVSAKVKQLAGSTLGLHGADKLRKIQEEYVKNHPHHIPLLFMLDVIHGHDTVFPCPLGQGATFNPETSKKGAQIQAKEAAADGIHVTFSPMADLVRDARWGRVVESTGEDPYLNGVMTAAMVEGYQGDNIADHDHVAACVKHFAAYGGSEAGRDYNNVELSEYALKDQYLRAYKKTVDAGVKMAMTSFNTLNGIPSSGNKWLMRDVLRKEMGFDGVLISDWGAIGEMVPWGLAADLKEAAHLAIEAGVDIDMCTESYGFNLATLIEEGKIDEKLVDEAVLRVLNLKNELGLFEDPYHGASAEKYEKLTFSEESREVARAAVRESLVLLENKENALPLNSKKISLIGPYVDEKNLQSSWAITCNADTNVTLRQAFTEAFEGTDTELRFANGCTLLDEDADLGFFHSHLDNFEADNEKLLAEALEAADFADIVIMCLGESAFQTGESTSKAEIKLPEIQLELFKKIKATGKKIITLIFNGRPLDLGNLPEESDALMICFRPGTEGGHGIADVLTGKFSPQGKLPMSFPYCVGQEPLYYNNFNTGRPKPTDRYSAFTTRYLDCPNEARYPFGYGLTYSDFEISEVTLDKAEMKKAEGISSASATPSLYADGDKIVATATVTNKGKVEATQTVQLYIRDLVGSRVRPVKELKGFKKVTLAPGESTEVSFVITEDMLAFFTLRNVFETEAGKFKVFLGFDSATENAAEFELK
ncbi:beta-glucosidase BglX [Butyrivibrio sp. AE3006]|uniref:beta-glucosidase BglX n=1 Tax=Butyrivibrio sp. AE3006 TaxID=1280673 RepID=UPI0003FA7BAA|nr:beta-glucosidase BglX [Butyrivibrio sp. AE3006]